MELDERTKKRERERERERKDIVKGMEFKT